MLPIRLESTTILFFSDELLMTYVYFYMSYMTSCISIQTNIIFLTTRIILYLYYYRLLMTTRYF